jgi:hypothetical protein
MVFTPSENPIGEGQSWEIDLFRADDAEGVIRLFNTVYGDAYPIATFTDPQQLMEENAAKRTISCVARTPKGDIVAHVAMFQSAPHKGVYESGAGLVLPAYRAGSIMTKLLEYSYRVADEVGVDCLFGEPVCNHTHMQKIGANHGFTVRALSVDLMPAATYVLEKRGSGRVSVTEEFRIHRPAPQTVFFPPTYSHIRDFLYEGMEDQRQALPSEADLPIDIATQLSTQIFDFAQVARINVKEAGQDLAASCMSQETALVEKGVVVLQVWLRLCWPWVGAATEVLRRQGYFLGGILPYWFETDGLLMQKLLGPPNWEGIQLYTDRAKTLLELVRLDWSRTAERV